MISDRVIDYKPRVYEFVKDVPSLCYKLTTKSVPGVIKRNLCKAEGQPYSDYYLRRNEGGAIALSMTNDDTDFYMISEAILTNKYQVVPGHQLEEKNP